MKKFIAALALTIALPSAAYAQKAPAEKGCCEKMKAEGKECCCKNMGKGHDDHQMDDKAPK